jgi:hypothetical protein
LALTLGSGSTTSGIGRRVGDTRVVGKREVVPVGNTGATEAEADASGAVVNKRR